MKIKDGFILRKIADKYIVVSVASGPSSFNGMISLNSTGAFLWELATKNADEKILTKAVLENYDIDEQTAREDVKKFINKLTEANLLK